MTDATETEETVADVVQLNGADKPAKKATKKKAAKKATKKATAKKATAKKASGRPAATKETNGRTLEAPVPLSEFFADDGLDWDMIEAEGVQVDWETWNRLGDNATRAGTGGWWWSGDWWRWGQDRYDDEKLYQVVDPMRITTKTLSNRAWVCGKIPRDHRRVHTVEPSLHMLAAELETLDEIDFVLERAEAEGLNWQDMRKLVRKVKAGQDPDGPDEDEGDGEGDPPEDPTRCNGTISLSADVAYLADMKTVTQKLRDLADEMLAEHGVGGATVTHTVK